MVYSFLDVQATLTGPGGSIPLGSGAAVAKEGITIELEAKNNMTIGADGQGTHALIASNAGHPIVRLLKTSPTNALLNAMYNYQRQSSSFWGQNIIVVTNPATGDDFTCQEVAFAQHTGVTWAEDPTMNEWRFDAINIDPILGSGILS